MFELDQLEPLFCQAHEPCQGAIILPMRSHLEEFFAAQDLAELRKTSHVVPTSLSDGKTFDQASTKRAPNARPRPIRPSVLRAEPRRLYRHCMAGAASSRALQPG